MKTPQPHPQHVQGVTHRELLKTGLTAGLTLSTWPLYHSPVPWAEEAGQPKHGGILVSPDRGTSAHGYARHAWRMMILRYVD
jgi:hypothetical protein